VRNTVRPVQDVSLTRTRLAHVLAAFALGILCLAVPCRTAEQSLERAFVVSWCAVGPDADVAASDAEGFIASLGARPGLAARSAGRKAGAWYEPPRGVEPNAWVSLVQVGFRTRRDWLAFIFDGPKGAATIAARRPARAVVGKSARRDWIPPGEYQISENAVKELAADFGRAIVRDRKQDEAALLTLAVKPWDHKPPRTDGDAFDFHETKAEDEGGETGIGPVGPAIKEDLDGFLALGLAAASNAGWQPTAQAAERRLLLEVARGVNTYSVRATLTDAGAQRQLIKENIPAEDIYANLLRLCLKLRSAGCVRDCQRFGSSAAPLAWSDGRLVIVSDGALEAWEPAGGRRFWRLPPPQRGAYLYTTASDENGRDAVFRYDGALMRITADGTLKKLSDAAPAARWAFCIIAGGDVIVMGERTLSRCTDGNAVWTFQSASRLSAGPVCAEERVFCGTQSGEALCLSAAYGKEAWRVQMDEALTGPLACAAGLVIGATQSGKLIALKAADGHLTWTADAGDVLLEPVRATEHGLLVASKDNSLRLLDAATGVQKASFKADTWLRSVVMASGCIVCTDLRGQVTFLDAAALKPMRTVPLPQRPAASVVFAPAFPELWAAADGLIYEEKPTVIVADSEGFLWMLTVPSVGGTNR
jgi:outer membrane protein assembly factor BamB